MRFPTIIVVLLIGMLCVGSLDAADRVSQRPVWPAYFLSIFLGFGSGQYYLGESGTGYLLGEIGGIAGVLAGTGYLLYTVIKNYDTTLPPSSFMDAVYSDALLGYGVMLAGFGVFVVVRVLEIVDVVTYESRRDGDTAFVSPLIDVRPRGVSLSIRMRY